MTEDHPGGTGAPPRPLLRNPFLWAGAFAILVLVAILLLGRGAGADSWPPALYLSEADAAGSRWTFRGKPGGPPLTLDWTSMTSSTTSSGGRFSVFMLSIDLHEPATEPVLVFLRDLGPWREPRRTYATKGETVEAEGARWFVLRPE